MKCPECGCLTNVLETRNRNRGWGLQYRRRECENGHRFTTEESAVSSRKGNGKSIMSLPWWGKNGAPA